MISALLLTILAIFGSVHADYFRRPASKACAAELESITNPPPNQVPAAQYFAPMEAKIRRQKALWFNPAIAESVLLSFAAENQVDIRVRNAYGAFVQHNAPIPQRFVLPVTITRSWAMDQAEITKDFRLTYYTFIMFNDFGEMLTVTLIKENSLIPRQQFCFKQKSLKK